MGAARARPEAQPGRRRLGRDRRGLLGRRGAQEELTARLLIEYDGAGFSGWARQPGKRTLQEVLEEGLERVRREPTVLRVAGRTDAGVHARGQVASHSGEPALARSINGVLPGDVRVVASEPAADAFDARRDALSRVYRYRVHARVVASPFERTGALHWPHRLDRGLLDRCAALLPGTHDFTAFTPTETYHQRFDRDVMRAEWLPEDDDVIAFWIEADTFMRHMVRTLVGSMLAVASGRRELDWFAELLEGRPRADAGDTAAAHGLYLEAVTYPEPEST